MSIMDKVKKGLFEDVCPHCGAPLNSRHARRMHLTMRVCQGGAGEFPPGDLVDNRLPEVVNRELTPEEIKAMVARADDEK